MRKTLAATFITIGLVAGGTTAASADHTHVRRTPAGCVVLAKSGNEYLVNLPGDDYPDNKDHPLHVNVHKGKPGEKGNVFVMGSAADDCNSYLNYP